ncbi:hypothetical protein EVA_05924 [gut metagenome]|uniref:Uncharacterized protein n=1 Tax=gut metagenome TaxID=749906 RepID=J9GTC3_9ZZZZ
MIIKERLQSRISNAFTRYIVSLMNLQTEFFGHRYQRIRLFIHHIGEVFGLFSKQTDGHLVDVFFLNGVLHFVKRTSRSRLNRVNLDEMPAEITFHRSDNIAGLGFKDSLFKGRYHHAASEETEVAAVSRRAGIHRVFLSFLRKRRRIGLDAGQYFFGFRLGGVLVVTEGNQNMTCTALFRDRPALLILFIISLNFFLIDRHLTLEIVRGQRDIFDIHVFGRLEFILMGIIISLDFFRLDRHLVEELIHIDNLRADMTFFGQNLIEMTNHVVRHRIRAGNSSNESLTRKRMTDFPANC